MSCQYKNGATILESDDGILQSLAESLMRMQRSMGIMKMTLEKTHHEVCIVAKDFREQVESTLCLEKKLTKVERRMESCVKSETPRGSASAYVRPASSYVRKPTTGCPACAGCVPPTPFAPQAASSVRLNCLPRPIFFPGAVTDVAPNVGIKEAYPAVLPRSASCTCPVSTYCAERLAGLGKRLIKAAHDGKWVDVRKLLDEGANPNFTSGSKWTPLHRSAWSGYPNVVALLLERGANVRAKTAYGFTPLHIAAYNDPSGECVSLLVAAGSELDCKNMSGWTPLHYAAECGNEPAVRTLIAAGAFRTIRNNEEKTPLDVTKEESIRELLSLGYSCNECRLGIE